MVTLTVLSRFCRLSNANGSLIIERLPFVMSNLAVVSPCRTRISSVIPRILTTVAIAATLFTATALAARTFATFAALTFAEFAAAVLTVAEVPIATAATFGAAIAAEQGLAAAADSSPGTDASPAASK